MFTLPNLPYPYDALEPFIDTETMHFHHDKHHSSYVEKLNAALANHDEFLKMDINDLISNLDKVPESIRDKVRNNGGGHANHSLFWQIMSANSKEPSGKLLAQIKTDFGSFEDFKKQFTETSLNIFGSGWGNLVLDQGKLEILPTANQDSPLTEGKTPILLVDVWEHAYYLKYQNLRAKYLDAWWDVVNWEKVSGLFDLYS